MRRSLFQKKGYIAWLSLANQPRPPKRALPFMRRVYCARPHLQRNLFRATEPARRFSRHGPASPMPAITKVGHMAKVAFLGLGVMGFPMADIW